MFPRRRRAAAAGHFAALLRGLPAGRPVVATLPRRNAHALAVNALIEQAAASGQIRIADMRGMTLRSLIGTRAEDHFHPNEHGYARITDAFGRAIDRTSLPAGSPDGDGPDASHRGRAAREPRRWSGRGHPPE